MDTYDWWTAPNCKLVTLEAAQAAVAAERERCEEICEELSSGDPDGTQWTQSQAKVLLLAAEKIRHPTPPSASGG
jgi:hypothetical protein